MSADIHFLAVAENVTHGGKESSEDGWTEQHEASELTCGRMARRSRRQGRPASLPSLLMCCTSQARLPLGAHLAAGMWATRAATARHSCVLTGCDAACTRSRSSRESLKLSAAPAGSSSKSLWTCNLHQQSGHSHRTDRYTDTALLL